MREVVQATIDEPLHLIDLVEKVMRVSVETARIVGEGAALDFS